MFLVHLNLSRQIVKGVSLQAALNVRQISGHTFGIRILVKVLYKGHKKTYKEGFLFLSLVLVLTHFDYG